MLDLAPREIITGVISCLVVANPRMDFQENNLYPK